jgi:serine/threonine-protein kinase RsbW
VTAREPLRLVVPVTLLGARAATERIIGLCDQFDTETRALYGTAVMEWLVNVVKHSCADVPGAQVTVHVIPGPQSIELVIEDTGRGMPADRFDAAPREVNFDVTDVAQLPEAGMGIAIVKSVMDTVRYETVGGVNRFTAVRRWIR